VYNFNLILKNISFCKWGGVLWLDLTVGNNLMEQGTIVNLKLGQNILLGFADELLISDFQG